MSRTSFEEIRWLEEIDSTNRLALTEARAGAPEGLVVAADHQSAGRGRLGRRWEAPAGSSLLASVLLRPVLPADRLFWCTAALALGAADACEEQTGVSPALKWPNDLVVDDGKLAGVLAEADAAAPGGAPGSIAVVVGIGLNVDWSGPPGAEGTSLRAQGGRAVDRRSLLVAVLEHFEPRYRALAGVDGQAALAAELAQRCCTLGRAVRVSLADGVVEGTAVGLSERGGLVVAHGGRRTEVSAGDVVHVRPAT